MVIATLLFLVKCSPNATLFPPQHLISYIWYQTYLVKFQQPSITVTGCKLPQAVQFTFNYEHVGVGLCELVLLTAGFLRGISRCLTRISSLMKFK